MRHEYEWEENERVGKGERVSRVFIAAGSLLKLQMVRLQGVSYAVELYEKAAVIFLFFFLP